MKKITILLLSFIFVHYSYSQKLDKEQYIVVKTGFLANNTNSLGIRTFFEYQKDFSNKIFYGISFDHSNYFGRMMTDYYPTPRNLDIINYNVYYKINIFKEKVYWTVGLGAGVFHAYWKNENNYGVVANIDAALNIKLTKNITLQADPVPIPIIINRFYISPNSIINGKDNWMASLAYFGYGVKIKL